MDVLLIILIANVTAAIGQLVLKIGMGSVGQIDNLDIQKVFQTFTNHIVITGLVIYAISTMFWLTALSRKDLSYVYPFFAVTIVLVLLLSKFVLNETVGTYRIAGVVTIAVGILLISRT